MFKIIDEMGMNTPEFVYFWIEQRSEKYVLKPWGERPEVSDVEWVKYRQRFQQLRFVSTCDDALYMYRMFDESVV